MSKTTKQARVIGPVYKKGPTTTLDPRLEGTFKLSSFPGTEFRIHPNCDGLICHDGEVVVQSHNGPDGGWLDFIREQQSRVLAYLVVEPKVEEVRADVRYAPGAWLRGVTVKVRGDGSAVDQAGAVYQPGQWLRK
jgi:hypothetical protein